MVELKEPTDWVGSFIKFPGKEKTMKNHLAISCNMYDRYDVKRFIVSYR